MSENFKTAEHSFTGTPQQKEYLTVVRFHEPTQIDFLPKEMLNDFPELNGIIIGYCETFKTVRDNLFTEDFGAIQYLSLNGNKIAKIEANAFQRLPKLKWINLAYNQLRSLPNQIFKNNPELIFIGLDGNTISSITPDFFQNLDKLQRVNFYGNECTKKDFRCYSYSCLVSQEELDSALSTCYSNCLNDHECASESGKLGN